MTAIEKELLIIDTDCGVDDALAILLVIYSKKFEILGITCVGGNTTLENVCSNVLRVLKISGKTDIPVFKGLQSGIMGQSKVHGRAHGDDGFGGIAHTIDVDQSNLKSEHAVNWLARTVAAYSGHVTLMTLGPLTNIAMAHLMFPDFSSHLKRLHTMGGLTNAHGNISPTGEFNFVCDPESAHIVMTKFSCPISLVTWDLCIDHSLSWDWYKEKILASNSVKANFVVRLFKMTLQWFKENPTVFKGFLCCDLLAAAVLVDQSLVEERIEHHVTVELAGHVTRGQMVVDWRDFLKQSSRVEIIRKVDLTRLATLYENLLL